MARNDGTVICPVCNREVRARRPPGGDGSAGQPVKHKAAPGHDCDGWMHDIVDWKREPGTVPAGWRPAPI